MIRGTVEGMEGPIVLWGDMGGWGRVGVGRHGFFPHPWPLWPPELDGGSVSGSLLSPPALVRHSLTPGPPFQRRAPRRSP